MITKKMVDYRTSISPLGFFLGMKPDRMRMDMYRYKYG